MPDPVFGGVLEVLVGVGSRALAFAWTMRLSGVLLADHPECEGTRTLHVPPLVSMNERSTLRALLVGSTRTTRQLPFAFFFFTLTRRPVGPETVTSNRDVFPPTTTLAVGHPVILVVRS